MVKCPNFKYCEKRQYMEFLVDEKIVGRTHPLLKWVKEKLDLCSGNYPILGRCEEVASSSALERKVKE